MFAKCVIPTDNQSKEIPLEYTVIDNSSYWRTSHTYTIDETKNYLLYGTTKADTSVFHSFLYKIEDGIGDFIVTNASTITVTLSGTSLTVSDGSTTCFDIILIEY